MSAFSQGQPNVSSRRRRAGLVAAAVSVVLIGFAMGPAYGASRMARVSVLGLHTDAATYSPGATVTFGATYSSRRPIQIARLIVAVRNSAGRDIDFNSDDNVTASSTAQQISKSRPFAAGTYTYWVAAFNGTYWTDLTSHRTLVVGTGTGTSTTTSTSSPTVPTTSVTTTPTVPPTTTAPKTTTVASTPAPPTPTGSRASVVGITIPGTELLYESSALLNADLDKVVASGATWLRVDAPPSEMEEFQGQTNWGNLDRVVAAAQAHNLKVLGILNTLPVWSRPAGAPWNTGASTDTERAAFTDFASRAAARYKGKVSAWEVWNEPNMKGFWLPTPSISDYAKLLQSAAPAIRAAAPGTPILTAGTGWINGPPDVPTLDWYNGLYATGAPKLADAIAVHPYPDFSNAAAGEMGRAVQVRQIMNANGDTAKQIWGTETGAPTGGSGFVSEAAQATLLTQTYNVWNTIPNHGPLFYYTLNDWSNHANEREDAFGLFRFDGTAKPSFAALQAWAKG